MVNGHVRAISVKKGVNRALKVRAPERAMHERPKGENDAL